MFSALLIVLLAAGGVYASSRYAPAATERWFRRIWTFRMVFLGIFWLIFGYFAIASGFFPLMLAGFAIYALAAAYVIFENPQQALKSWTK